MAVAWHASAVAVPWQCHDSAMAAVCTLPQAHSCPGLLLHSHSFTQESSQAMATVSDAEADYDLDFELAVAPHTPLTELASAGEPSSRDGMELLPEESTGECCKCCEDCCSERCGCKACCGRCRRRCRSLCCRKCCAHRCLRNQRNGPTPVDVTWNYALRQVANDNIALGCVFQFHPWPSFLERWLLLLLFLATAVFVQYSEEAMGPICVREYLAQCKVFTTPKTLLPMTYIRLPPVYACTFRVIMMWPIAIASWYHEGCRH